MHYALKDRYPIETEEQIKTAFDYFEENIRKFSPADRVKIADNLEKRAGELNINPDLDFIPNYSRMTKEGASYSPDFEYNIKLRKEACEVGGIKVGFNGSAIDGAELITKIASMKGEVTPLQMVASLEEFDKAANLEHHYDTRIMDPVFTVYGSNSNPEYDFVKVAEGLTDYDLKRAASDRIFMSKLASTFGDDFAKDFQSSPVDIFQSMPAPEKEIILNKLAANRVNYKCGECGYNMTAEERSGKVICPKCGAGMKKASKNDEPTNL